MKKSMELRRRLLNRLKNCSKKPELWRWAIFQLRWFPEETAESGVPYTCQTWKYMGGYTRRRIELKVDQNGTVSQVAKEEKVVQPTGAADSAVIIRVEGWEVPLDSRILVQVTPENAPFVVASVGSIVEVENKIITPAYRSVSRNVLGHVDMRVLDLLYQRSALEKELERYIVPEGLKAGLIIREVRFGDPAVPPELLIPGKREQLAKQMKKVFEEEKKAQDARVAAERKKAEADQQTVLMKAEIGRKAASEHKERERLLGEGEKLRLQAVAEGQKAQAQVLGQKLTYELSVLQMVLEKVAENPEHFIKVPQVLVSGDGGGLAGAAAILGYSNLAQTVRGAGVQ